MGFYALFRLLWRRVSILSVLGLGFAIAWSLFLYQNQDGTFLFQVPRLGGLNLFILVFSAVVGSFVGQSVDELQYKLFSWILPYLRRRLFCSVLFVGIVTAFIVTWVYKWFDGPAPWVPIFTSALLWYSMGIVSSTGDVRDGSDRSRRPHGVAFFTMSALVVAGFSINRIADFYATHPLLCVLLTVVGASLCLYRSILDVNTTRKKSLALVPIVLIDLATGRSWEKEVIAWKRTARRKWQHTGPITGLFNWIRAGEYENFASNRGGWAAGVVKLSGIAVLIVMALPYLAEVQGPAFLKAYQKVYQLLAPGIPAFLAMFYCTDGSFFLQKGWLYPLSRTQLARLTYWGSLLYNVVICGIMLLVFLFLESLIKLDAGYDFIRPLTMMFIFIPVIQWLRLRYGLVFTQIPIAFVLFLGVICVVALSGFLWVLAALDISDLYEVAACAGLVLLSQCLFRYKVVTYFKRGDLV